MGNELHFAVVVGINCYPGMDRRRQLTTSRDDAENVASWLYDHGKLPDENIEMVVATDAEESAFDNKYLRSRPICAEVFTRLQLIHDKVQDLNAKDRQRTRLYFYAAAHGLMPEGGLGAVIFADSSPSRNYWGSGYLDIEKGRLSYKKHTYFAEVLLLSDCCREVNKSLQPASDWPFTARYQTTPRTFVGYATQPKQRAGARLPNRPAERKEAARGFFTAAILEGLKGAARHDVNTGILDSSQLTEYVKDRVPILARDNGYSQAAEIESSGDPIALVSMGSTKDPISMGSQKCQITAKLPYSWHGKLTLHKEPPAWTTVDEIAVSSDQVVLYAPPGFYVLAAGGDLSRHETPELRSQPFVVDPDVTVSVVELEHC